MNKDLIINSINNILKEYEIENLKLTIKNEEVESISLTKKDHLKALDDDVVISVTYLYKDKGELFVSLIGFFPDTNNIAALIINDFNVNHDFKFEPLEISKLIATLEYNDIENEAILVDNLRDGLNRLLSKDVKNLFASLNTAFTLSEFLLD